MAILSALRRSRAGAAAVLLGAVGFLTTAGAFGACGADTPNADGAIADSTVASSARKTLPSPTSAKAS